MEVAESLGAKVLHTWLQSRRPRLYPLTVRFRALEPRKAMLLAQLMAVTLLAGAPPVDPARVTAAAEWLASAGADEATRAALHAALDLPPPLSRLLNELQQTNMAAPAYVIALTAASRDPTGQLFLGYLAARLGLPASIVRRANRRYRRRAVIRPAGRY